MLSAPSCSPPPPLARTIPSLPSLLGKLRNVTLQVQLFPRIKRCSTVPSDPSEAVVFLLEAERTSEYGIPIYLAFVEFNKAFDFVEWCACWQALWSYGANPTVIHLLRRIFEFSTTLIRVSRAASFLPYSTAAKHGHSDRAIRSGFASLRGRWRDRCWE